MNDSIVFACAYALNNGLISEMVINIFELSFFNENTK